MQKNSPSLKLDILHHLRSGYGIDGTTLELLRGGADINAVTYKATAADLSTYFVKLKKGHELDISLMLVTSLFNEGINEVISPIKTIKNELSTKIGESTLIVYPFITGEDGFSHSLSDDQWISFGKAMRKVHDFKVPLSLLDKIKKETYHGLSRKALRALFPHLEEKPKGDETRFKFWESMREHQTKMESLVDLSEKLSHEVQKLSDLFVLCHSDIHGGNVFISDEKSLYLVDWDDPIMAPKERDLMFIGGGVANVWNHPHEVDLFYKGYGKTTVNQKLLAYYRLERIVVDIAEYGQALLLSLDGGDDRQVMYHHFLDMFKPQGVVEIAFETARNL